MQLARRIEKCTANFNLNLFIFNDFPVASFPLGDGKLIIKRNKKTSFKNQTYEHIYTSFDHPDCIASGCVADVALQQRLGLLSQRRFRFGRIDPGHSFTSGKIVNFEGRQIFGDAKS